MINGEGNGRIFFEKKKGQKMLPLSIPLVKKMIATSNS
ncbi:MAG: hypothetical protein RLZZ77_1836 [Bacteroidota bacterium]